MTFGPLTYVEPDHFAVIEGLLGYYTLVSMTLNAFAVPTPDASRPFEGLGAALDDLQAQGYRFAVCTNKLEWLSKRLLDQLGREANIVRNEYRYHDAYYEGIEQEFRGFGAADAVTGQAAAICSRLADGTPSWNGRIEWSGTFHAVGARLLRLYAGFIVQFAVDGIDYYVILARWKLAVVLGQGYERAGEDPMLQAFGPVVLDLMRGAADLAETTRYGR